MKKTIALLLVVVMALGLCACEKSTVDAPEKNSAPAEVPAEAPAEVPAEVPAEAPAEVPAEAPASKPFTNKYGTATTKCVVSGCNNYIAPSGDTNCCRTHSNKCQKCRCYIDGDATYCMDCISSAASNNSSNNSYSSNNNYSSNNSYNSSDDYDYDKGFGYTAPKEGQSFSDYVKEQDPELYASLFG